jgi:6-phosphogluconolactonase
MDEIEWWEFESAREMAEQVAGDICFVMESAIEAHGSARIALPGADSAQPVFDALAAKKMDWSKVTVIPTDDRLVPLGHEGSLYAKLTHLFGARGATIVSLIDESALDAYREAGRLADARLALLEWPLDLVLLGVEADGSTAGMLPGPDLDRAVSGPRERRAVGLRPSGDTGDRVTLTGVTLASARSMMIVVRGDEERAALEGAIKDGPLSARSVGRVLAEIDTAIDIFWSPE